MHHATTHRPTPKGYLQSSTWGVIGSLELSHRHQEGKILDLPVGLDPCKTPLWVQALAVWDSPTYLLSVGIPTKTSWDLTGDFAMSSNPQFSCFILEQCTPMSSIISPLPPSKIPNDSSYTALSSQRDRHSDTQAGAHGDVLLNINQRGQWQVHAVVPVLTGPAAGKTPRLMTRQGTPTLGLAAGETPCQTTVC